jgi:hypothetical protein
MDVSDADRRRKNEDSDQQHAGVAGKIEKALCVPFTNGAR